MAEERSVDPKLAKRVSNFIKKEQKTIFREISEDNTLTVTVNGIQVVITVNREE